MKPLLQILHQIVTKQNEVACLQKNNDYLLFFSLAYRKNRKIFNMSEKIIPFTRTNKATCII